VKWVRHHALDEWIGAVGRIGQGMNVATRLEQPAGYVSSGISERTGDDIE
jgi:hypothetical protein